jgi:exodeoxyribonuclease-3
MIPKDHYPSEAKILRVVSINVNGLRSSVTKGLLDWLEQSDADVVCIQESRITHAQWTDKFKPEGWHTHLFPAERAGYAGTAIYSRLPFLSVRDGLGFELADSQGRFICAEFDLGLEQPVHIASLYLPSGSSGEEAQIRKDQFLDEYKKS